MEGWGFDHAAWMCVSFFDCFSFLIMQISGAVVFNTAETVLIFEKSVRQF